MRPTAYAFPGWQHRRRAASTACFGTLRGEPIPTGSAHSINEKHNRSLYKAHAIVNEYFTQHDTHGTYRTAMQMAMLAMVRHARRYEGHFRNLDALCPIEVKGCAPKLCNAILRYTAEERFLVVVNFAATPRRQCFRIPADAWRLMGSTWNECITPSDMLGNALYIGRDSIHNIQERGLEVEIPAHDGIILKF